MLELKVTAEIFINKFSQVVYKGQKHDCAHRCCFLRSHFCQDSAKHFFPFLQHFRVLISKVLWNRNFYVFLQQTRHSTLINRHVLNTMETKLPKFLFLHWNWVAGNLLAWVWDLTEHHQSNDILRIPEAPFHSSAPKSCSRNA